MRMPNAVDKLGGLFGGNKAPDKNELMTAVGVSQALVEVTNHRGWKHVLAVLKKFEDDCAQTMAQSNVSEPNLVRVNHRSELLAQIRKEIQSRIDKGQKALETLRKEEDNA